jgi:hypothetical protein
MNPGETALTRISAGARSLAALLARAITAPFVAEYADMFGAPVTPAIDAVSTMLPPAPCATIAAAAAESTANTPVTLTSSSRRSSSTGSRSTRSNYPCNPALANSPVGVPNESP